ncbi:peroxidase 5-like [Silene latifolia]|uniref:peroxidase 5-like n=1 Tax=Silene latifolia TaxID=37657 RepID=UPI003D785775
MSSQFTLVHLLLVLVCLSVGNAQLGLHYYETSCPAVEKIIEGVVAKTVSKNPSLGAGCDGSVLLDSVDGKPSEKDSFVSKGLRGFEIVDEAEALLEEICPLTVSCADVLAYAARDAAAILGGLAKDDLVILSGAHSIGQNHCSLIENWIRSFSQTSMQDPSIDPNFADALKIICPAHVVNSTTNVIPLDFGSPNHLDAGYYNSVLKHKVIFRSNQALLDNTETRDMVKHYTRHGGAWKKDFAASMIRIGSIEVLVGGEGQIRKNCRVVNND